MLLTKIFFGKQVAIPWVEYFFAKKKKKKSELSINPLASIKVAIFFF